MWGLVVSEPLHLCVCGGGGGRGVTLLPVHRCAPRCLHLRLRGYLSGGEGGAAAVGGPFALRLVRVVFVAAPRSL